MISSDNQRTRQTVQPAAQLVVDRNIGYIDEEIELHKYFHRQQTDLIVSDIEDGLQDGVMQIPALDANSKKQRTDQQQQFG